MFKLHSALMMGALMAATSGEPYGGTTGPLPPMHQGGETDPYLTDLAIADMEADTEFLTPQVFPRLNVPTQSGKFKVWDRGTLLRPEFRLHAYGDRPVQAATKTGEGSYDSEHRSLEQVVAPSDRASARANPMQPEEDAVLYLTGQARMDLDLRFVQGFMRKGAGWAYQYQGVPSNPNTGAASPEFLQFDQPGVNVAQFIRGRAQRMALMTGKKPNVLVLGADVYAALVFNEDIVDRVKYVQRGVADMDLLAAFFDVGKVLNAGGVYNKALEGQDDDFGYIVDPKGFLLTYAAPRPSRMTPSGGYMFVWDSLYENFESDSNEKILGALALIRRGYDSRSGVRWVQAHTAVGMGIVAPDYGMYFSDAVATSYSDY